MVCLAFKFQCGVIVTQDGWHCWCVALHICVQFVSVDMDLYHCPTALMHLSMHLCLMQISLPLSPAFYYAAMPERENRLSYCARAGAGCNTWWHAWHGLRPLMGQCSRPLRICRPHGGGWLGDAVHGGAESEGSCNAGAGGATWGLMAGGCWIHDGAETQGMAM